MGVHIHGGTMSGALTPICDCCGISLCWDIDRTTYLEAKPFWDDWRCQDCAGTRLSAFRWRTEHGHDALPDHVRAVCDQFAEDHPDFGEQDCATSSEEACRLFSAALEASGYGSSIRAIDVPVGAPHHVVDLGDMTIDWTAVRHDEAAPFPLTFRTRFGWPITPRTLAQMLEDIADLRPDQMEALVASVVARRRAA